MPKKINRVLLTAFLVLSLSSILHAQDNKHQAMPPAQVAVAEVTAGMVAPQSEFIGTVYYQEVSKIASEVSGKVETVNFEEGQKIEEGHVFVKLSSDLLEKTLQATRAGYEQTLTNLKRVRRDFQRAKNLYSEKLLSEESYDARRFDVKSLEKKAASLKAEVERLEAELEKKVIKAPFKGIVIKKHIQRGEWLFTGSPVATVGNDSSLDIIVEVPESVIRNINPGMETKIVAGGKHFTGRVVALIPKGDISTRTFPVKIRTKNSLSLVEGMEARVTLPTGKKEKALIVPRDAVITLFGNTVVFAVNESKAMMIPVSIVGYDGMTVGIRARGLSEGMKVVVKGHERLRNGQAVKIKN